MPLKEIALKKRRTRKDYVFHQVYRTRWHDNDMYAHLNNTVYAQLFDSIINSYLITDCGMDPFSPAPAHASQIAVIASSYCDYFASVSYPDTLELGLRVTKLGGSSVTYEVGVFREGEDDVKVVGGYTHVWCTREDMKPAKGGMERRVREALERLMVQDGARL
ncbi:hypothetical protein P175DRAFT_0471536 [Aspergillus ochraceoroseus IBT 24754]|uniref:Thioesterase domain-containing protein n=2 Tax=Aspergillus ochraceoroseus TaxID=138278 RepID=A0A2T5M8R5_9EURO|nr:uncharacterized protein P175DRAFT_0471536 [Aspergillus ochraceoroseus IBT 24754]KKK15848.1 hypothetical protein AOCH_004101 [Aspergillus ochraceoroseus]PTU24914.1 hypothetical protein P175DRAFT_0471536 [Aspergillus ochraceoroseus IBT 24754]